MRKIVLFMLVNMLISGNIMAESFNLTSPQMKEGGLITNEQVFNGFGCQGGNISPALEWKGAPKETQSFAVSVYDPDAPTGSGWWHWVIFNIPASVVSLTKNAGNIQANIAPSGSIQSRTDFGKPGYGGPCPPMGDKPHRYQFSVYALKADKLPLDENASAALVGFYLNQTLIKKTTLNVQYGK